MKERTILMPFVLLTIITLLLNVAIQMTLPTFSIYLNALDFPIRYIGAVSLSLALAGLFLRPVSAILSLRIGRIETGIVGTLLFLLAYMMFAFFTNPELIVLGRIFQGMGMGLVITMMGSVVAQILPSKDILKGMNIYSLFASSSAAIGPYLGMALIADGQFARLFFVATGLVVISILLLIIMKFKDVLPPVIMDEQEKLKSQIPVYRTKAVFPTILGFFSAIVYAGIASYLAILGLESGMDNVGFFFMFSFVGLILSRFVVSRWIHTYSLSALLSLFGFGYAIALLLIVQFPTILGWSLIAIGFGFVFNFLATLFNTMALKHVSISQKASANAMLFIGLDLGFFSGGLLWGQVADRFSTSSIYVFSAVLIVVSMNVGALIAKVRKITF